MPKFEYIISDQQEGERLDKALTESCTEHSRSQIQKAIKAGHVVVNEQIISNLSRSVKHNDKISLFIEEEKPQDIVPANIPLDIIYEDDDLIVINKDSNMTVHPGAGENSKTLVNALLYHSNSLSDIGGEIRPGIVHRLDKNTTGLMVVAKNNKAHQHLSAQIESRELKRKYKALIWGILKPFEGVIDANIARSNSDRTKMTIVKNGGKHAITHYKTEEIFCSGLVSLVECTLDTGRTHQIRVHLSQGGNSVVGDQTYGNNARKIRGSAEHLQAELKKMNNQALHSYYISFAHPTSGEILEFEKSVPNDYNELIEFLRKQ